MPYANDSCTVFEVTLVSARRTKLEFDQPLLDDTFRFFWWRTAGPETGEDFFGFECVFGFKAVLTLEKVLGFKEHHAASCIAFVFDMRGTAVVVLETHLTMKKKKLYGVHLQPPHPPDQQVETRKASG